MERRRHSECIKRNALWESGSSECVRLIDFFWTFKCWGVRFLLARHLSVPGIKSIL